MVNVEWWVRLSGWRVKFRDSIGMRRIQGVIWACPGQKVGLVVIGLIIIRVIYGLLSG